ncbi:MAG: hypothetical protein WCD79_13665 [Chthoniobacteraceae bacterium]
MKKTQKYLRSLLLELAVYTALVVVYFFAVLHFLGEWLKRLFDANKLTYAIVALLLIVGQGVGLEMITTKLLKLVRSRSE